MIDVNQTTNQSSQPGGTGGKKESFGLFAGTAYVTPTEVLGRKTSGAILLCSIMEDKQGGDYAPYEVDNAKIFFSKAALEKMTLQKSVRCRLQVAFYGGYANVSGWPVD